MIFLFFLCYLTQSYLPLIDSEKAAAADVDKEEEEDSGGLATGWIVFLSILGFILLVIIWSKRYWFRWKYRRAKWHCIMCCYGMKDSVTLKKEPETVSKAFEPPDLVTSKYTRYLSIWNISISNIYAS